ncbi:MAG TPA: LON peptidase substrate-binding domain-containing protein [Caulobacteraceae bacterium]
MAAGPFIKAGDLPQVIPVFPLSGVLLLPHAQLPLNIFEPRYLNMVDDAMASERMIGMIQQLGGEAERPSLAAVGCLGRITSFAETSDGRYLITLSGLCRFGVGEELSNRLPYRQVRANFGPFESDLNPLGDDDGFDRLRFLRALKAFLERHGLEVDWDTAKSAPGEALVNSLAMALPFEAAERQALLEAISFSERRETLIALMEIDAADRSGDDDPHWIQ